MSRSTCARFAVLTAVIAILVHSGRAADNGLTEAERAAGWRLLFNGEDHTGWKCNNGKSIATPVEDGALVPYQSGGYLIVYEKPFADFELQCDVKMSVEECNSGIFFRVSDLERPVYTGFEAQVYQGGTGYHDFGAIYDLVPADKDVVKPIGEWNHVVIRCQGPEISVAVNGETVATMNCDDFDEPGLRPDGTKHKFGTAIKEFKREGYLGFQDHGHKVWFKNVKLREL